MAIDPSSIPKDLRPLKLNRTAIPIPSTIAPISADLLPDSPRSRLLFYPSAAAAAAAAAFPPQGFSNPILPVGPLPDQVAAEDGVEDQSLSKKVKFLCSFGGKILPRPSDGALRYAGGHTRIISLRKDASFQELMQKMEDAYGGPVVLKYQLPDEDLDALVSVSCPEDLENMMEEYEKLAESSLEGSAKLRVFLFSPSELDPSSGLNQLPDLNDTSQRYVDAVNGVPEYGLRRKDSMEGASPTQNSDGLAGDTMDGGAAAEGMSPAILSPTVAATSQDASKLVYLGAPSPVVFPESTGIPVNVAGPRVDPMPPAVAPFLPQAYVDPHQEAFHRMNYLHNPSQIQYVNPQQLGLGGAHVSLVALPSQPYMHINPAPSTAQVNSATPILPRGEPYLEENPYGGRVFHALPPLPPSSLQQPQNYEQYGWPQAPAPPQPHGHMLRVEDCHMCQKSLPHVHSDTLVQERGSASMVSVTEPVSMFHSLHSEDAMRSRVPQRVVTAAMANGIVENLVENMVSAPQVGTYGFSQIPNSQCNNERAALQKDNVDKGRVLYPPGGVGLPSDVQASYGVFSNNFSVSRHGDTLQQPLPPQYLAKQDIPISKPISSEVSQAWNGAIQNLEAPILDYGTEFSYDHSRPIEGMMGALRVTASETPGINEQWKVIKHNLGDSGPVNGMMEMGHMSPSEASGNSEQWGSAIKPIVSAPKDLRPESSALLTETVANVNTNVGGKEVLSSNAFVKPGITHEGNSFMPINQMQCSGFEVTHLQNPQVANSSQVTPVLVNPGLYPRHLENIGEPPIPHERLLGVTKATNKIPVGDQEDESSWFQSRNTFNEVSAPPSSTATFTLSNASSPNGYVGDVREPFPSDSLFSNADPWIMAQNTHFPPPIPKKVASKESHIPMDSWNETRLRKSGESDAAALLEEGAYHQPSDPLNKDSWPELIQYKKGSEDENIKQELQAVAEGVAASVFESSTPPVPSSYADETNGSSPESNKERAFNMDNVELSVDHDSELEKTNLGFQISEDIGRLQIIRNSDLEELRELGSGTFGTVYHGKWRGSDVAIKRINDRCFAGKPSEQDRLRADFWNEACKLADLHHPNVVAFYGVVLDGPGGSIATVTEYMVNGSLRHALQRNDKTLDRRKRLLIAMDVAFGMEYLHGKNIVHFDLKSDNLLVNLRDPQRPICKVGDLGLSKVKCQTLISGGVRGTLPWMAPELLNGSSSLVSEKVDVFSFGIVMWELLTGEEPYADLHYGAIIGGIVSNTLRPPVPEYCDPEWRSLMEECWSSEPSERPSFTKIASKLRSVAASLPQKGQAQQNSATPLQAQK